MYVYIDILSADMHASASTPRQCSFVTHLSIVINMMAQHITFNKAIKLIKI